MPISFCRSLRAFTSAVPNMTGESLDHLYIARVELTHRTALPVREGWTEVVQELAVVGLVPPGPEHEEANDPLSPATRFLHHLEEDLVPWHFDYMVDSNGDYLHPTAPSKPSPTPSDWATYSPHSCPSPRSQLSLKRETLTMTPPLQTHHRPPYHPASDSFMGQA